MINNKVRGKIKMKTLIHFSEFIDLLSQNNSSLYKQDILKSYKYDEDVKYYLNYIFNPYLITGIGAKKLKKTTDELCGLFLNKAQNSTVKDLLEFILHNNTGTDKVLQEIAAFKENLFTKYYAYGAEYLGHFLTLLDQIITKDVKLGVNVKTINKCMDNFLPEFNVQLANKYFDDPSRIEGKEFALTTKIDGCRIIALKENNKVSFYSRQGQIYEGLVDLEEEMFEKIPDNICLDGELTLLDASGLDSKNQYKQTIKLCRKDGVKHGLRMLVFDCMTAKQFRDQNCETSYTSRRETLEQIFNSAFFTYFKLLPILYKGTDTSLITYWLNKNVSAGEEGVMINVCDAPYHFDRSWDLQKVKKMNSYDLQIIGFEEGTGKFVNTLGAILCKYKDDNVVKCGSGFDIPIRDLIWKNKEAYMNRVAEIQYFEETVNQNGGASLRFPVFIDIRDDKSVADF